MTLHTHSSSLRLDRLVLGCAEEGYAGWASMETSLPWRLGGPRFALG
jgi:hypothetical protein